MVVNQAKEIIDLNDASEAVEGLRATLLFELKESLGGLPRYAEQNFLLALSHLDAAQRHLKIAWMEHMENR